MKEEVFERVKKYFVFLNLSDNELKEMVNKTFDETKNEEENVNKILSAFYAVVKANYEKGDISLIISANKFEYGDFLLTVRTLNNFSLFLEKCDIKFNIDLENEIKKETLGLDKTLKKISAADSTYINMLNSSSISLIDSSSYSIFDDLEYEEDYELENLEISDEKYEGIINEDSFPDDSTKQYYRDMGRVAKLTEEERKTLFKEYRETKNPKIRKRLIEANLGLVVSIAKEFKYEKNIRTFTLLELISIGNEGIIRAIEDYDPEKSSFSTYATLWIRQRISREIQNDCSPIRIPVCLKQNMYKYQKQKNELEYKYGRVLSLTELSEKTGVPVKTIKYYEMLLLRMNGVSLETPVGEEENSKLADFLVDSDTLTPEENAIVNDRSNIDYWFSKLNEVEKMVISLRFGLYDGRVYNLEEVSIKLYELGLKQTMLTRQRIEQIESRSLKKIRKVIEVSKNRTSQKDLYIKKNPQSNVQIEELNEVNTEFLKLVKLIRTCEVSVLSQSISQLTNKQKDVLKKCFGDNIYYGIPLTPPISVKREASFVILPLLIKIISVNKRCEKEALSEEIILPRNIYKYFENNSHYEVDKAIELLYPNERLTLARCYNFYTGDFIIDNTISFYEKKLTLNVLKTIGFNLPKAKVKHKKKKN